ncbi:hypothetical protein Bbelb_120800 [Branchiostoma belcheri]|nr:hypothetical protein Bbelb_120800 [Branchiostoma belcheri]
MIEKQHMGVKSAISDYLLSKAQTLTIQPLRVLPAASEIEPDIDFALQPELNKPLYTPPVDETPEQIFKKTDAFLAAACLKRNGGIPLKLMEQSAEMARQDVTWFVTSAPSFKTSGAEIREAGRSQNSAQPACRPVSDRTVPAASLTRHMSSQTRSAAAPGSF